MISAKKLQEEEPPSLESVGAAELRGTEISGTPCRARPHQTDGVARPAPTATIAPPGIQQRFTPLTQYTDTGAPAHDPFGVRATETHSRATIDDDAHTIMINRVAWGAIFAGVVVALVVQVLLTMLGAGIGMATLDPASADNPAPSTFSITAAVWWIVSGIIAAFAGGYIAARMSGRTVPTTGAFHGLTTWAFTTLVVLYLLTTTAGTLIGGVFSGVANAVGGVGQTVAQSAAPMLENADPLDAIEHQVRATGTDPEALNNAALNAIRQLLTGDAASADQARQQAAQALAQARKIPLDEARQQVATFEQQYKQTVDRAKQAASKAAATAASAISTGALAAFVALVLGAIAGWFGGRSGVVHPVFADGMMPRRHPA
jgi:hypothetical protein